MSRVSECLKQIMSARYGKDVRQSIHDGIKEIDGVARTAQNSAAANAQTASAKASEALTASQEALKKAQEAQEAAQQAKVYADNAEAVAGVNIGTKDKAGIVKGGENHIAEDGTLELVVKTTETTMPNSRKGGLEVDEIGGVCEQASTTGKNLWSYGDISLGTGSDIELSMPAGTYTFSSSNSAPNLAIRFFYVDDSAEVVLIDGLTKTFTLGKEVYKINFNNPSVNSITNIQVEAGTEATPYEPYTGGSPAPSPDYPQEIKQTVVSEIRTHGKNFLKNNIESKTQGGVTFTVDSDGCITANGTATGNVVLYFDDMVDKLKVGKTYVASGVKSVQIKYADGTNDYRGTFVFSKSMVEVKPYIQIASGQTVTNEKYYPMVRDRNDADDMYEPYTESVITLSQPIELNRIGDVQDVIDIERGATKKYLEVINLKDYITNVYAENKYYVVDVSPLKSDKTICTHFHYGGYAAYNGDVGYYFGIGGSSTQLRFSRYGFNSVEDFKTFVTNNDVKTICYLKTPAYEELPIADQIALNSLETFEGTTYIEFVSEVQPTFTGKYGASLVGGIALEGAMRSRENSLALSGDSFEFKEHGLTFKGLKIGKMMVLHVSGELDYGLTDENKVMTFETKIPDGFKPYIDTNAAVMNIKSRDSEGNRITVLYNLGIGRLGTLILQVEWKSSTGQTLLSPQATGIPLYMSMSYISE